MQQEFHISTTQNVDLGYEAASLGDRLVAYLIDIVIKGVYLFLVMIFLLDSVFNTFGEFVGNVFVYLLWLLPYLLYHLLFEVLNNGQSPGKRAMRLRVVSLDGTPVTLGSYLLRWLMRLVDIDLTTGLGAIISIAVSDRGQRIGDRVAGTTVVKQRSEVRLEHLAFVDETDDEPYDPTYPQVTALTAQHIEIIRETLANRHVIDISAHVDLLAEKIAAIMKVDVPSDPYAFLDTVARDFSHYHR
ncbi:MAG: RDD family protein [Saprospiraceae bacterium]|nr:RDD family protein [Saprospiraceae bacterium]